MSTARSVEAGATDAAQAARASLARPTNGWNPHWDRVWHGHHYHWNGGWGIVNDGDYPWDDSYYFPASSDVSPDMSYEYNDAGPSVGATVSDANSPDGSTVVTAGGAAPGPIPTAANRPPRPGSIAARMQRCLVARGYFDGPIDGVVGETTREAIADFQGDNGMAVTGTITQSLLEALGL